MRGEFGFFPFIIGTIEVTATAMVLTTPVCLLSAIYISEYAHRHVRELIRLVVDIMAGIPSVIYGLWGIIVIVPFVRSLGETFGHPTTGYSLLSGGIILAIMVSPIIISVSTEVLRAVPMEARETALALGTTRWETVKHVVLKNSPARDSFRNCSWFHPCLWRDDCRADDRWKCAKGCSLDLRPGLPVAGPAGE